MIACNCMLAGTKACLTCPQYQNMMWPEQAPMLPNVRPTRKITEKYDSDGKLIERIIEE